METAQPPSGGCVLKHQDLIQTYQEKIQPPSGGCVLKQQMTKLATAIGNQPPSGGCVLKLGQLINFGCFGFPQPPSGGCVLKPLFCVLRAWLSQPAAFRRLCVETGFGITRIHLSRPAAFRRLCVETMQITHFCSFSRQPPSGGCVLKPMNHRQAGPPIHQPPSGGCVLKQSSFTFFRRKKGPSRLQAAVC